MKRTKAFFTFAAVAAVVLCLGGCRTVEYIAIPTEHTDTLIITKHERDSIHVHDSIIEKLRGDTVWIERWHTRYRNHIVHDTTYISKTDSIPYPVEVTKEVPAQLTWWQQMRLSLANVGLYVLGFLLLGWILRRRVNL